jgi:hypothetical protein
MPPFNNFLSLFGEKAVLDLLVVVCRSMHNPKSCQCAEQHPKNESEDVVSSRRKKKEDEVGRSPPSRVACCP